MTISRRALLVACGAFLLCSSIAAQVPQSWKQIPKPPLPEFKPQVPHRIVLPNGMVIFLQEDHELPLIVGSARIRGGSREEPAEKTGLVSIYGQVWRTGGTKTRTGDELDDFLEARAAKLETSGGSDSTFISFNTLKADFEDVFKTFLELLREPAFREDKIDLAQKQLNTGISRRNDEIGEIAGREALRLAYGRENPYARIPEYDTVAAVKRDDLVNWHAAHVHPNNIILGMVGDFDAKQMEARLRQAFSSWPKGPAAKPAQIQFRDPNPGVYFIPKEDVNQSAIRMVHLGIRRDNADYFAVVVMNEILGGGFSSRLVSSIRTRRGLAYSVGGGVGSAFDHPGVFRISMGTKSDSTIEAIQALYAELDSLEKNPPSQVELQRATDTILNSFIFNFDSKEEVLAERMAYEFYGYPQDFLERFRAGIEKTTAADVARVARKYVPPKAKLAVLVVGKSAEFDKPLSTLGAVTTIDIAIPAPGQLRAQSK
jgi:zinc protease